MDGVDLCEGCKNWELHKEKCWYFWKFKKECTQFVTAIGDIPEFKKLE